MGWDKNFPLFDDWVQYGQIEFCAVAFNKSQIVCEIIVEVDPEDGGRVTGSGTYMEGQKVMVEVEPGEGFVFAGWHDDRGIIRSFSRKFEFEAGEDMMLSAVFDDSENAVFDSVLPDSWKSESVVPLLSPEHTHLLGL